MHIVTVTLIAYMHSYFSSLTLEVPTGGISGPQPASCLFTSVEGEAAAKPFYVIEVLFKLNK